METAFKVWMQEVDRILSHRIGLSSDDLSDRNYRDFFEDEMTPQEVADEVAAEETGFEEDAEDGDDDPWGMDPQ